MADTPISGYTDRTGRRVPAYHQRRQAGAGEPARAPSSAASKAMVVGGAAMLTVGTFRALTAATNLVTAILVVSTVLVLSVGGVMTKRQARAKVRKTFGRVGAHRRTGGRSRSPAAEKARTDRKLRLREQRWARRDAKADQRRATRSGRWSGVRTWFGQLFGPSQVTSSEWDRREAEAEVRDDGS
jgi:hypothetical protein